MGALLLGAAVSLGCLLYLVMSSAEAPVVVAGVDIEPHVRIGSDMLERRMLPEGAAHPAAISEVEMGAGRYSRRSIPAGTQVLGVDLVDPGDTAAGIPWGLEGTERAVAVPARPEGAVGGTLRPGHRVDVIHFAEPSVHGAAVARILLERIRVEDVRDASGAPWSPGDPNPPETAILAVDSRGAEALSYAMATGTLFLATVPYDAEAGFPGPGAGGGNLYDYVGREGSSWTTEDNP